MLQEDVDHALGQLQTNPLDTLRCPDTKNGGVEIARGRVLHKSIVGRTPLNCRISLHIWSMFSRVRRYLNDIRRNSKLAADRASAILSLAAAARADRLRREIISDSTKLAAHGFRGYSQADEDGILQEIFRRIGTTNKVIGEFGCGSGLENNTLYLLLSGWRGTWIDGNEDNIASVQELHADSIKGGKLTVKRETLTRENIDGTLLGVCAERSPDLVSIDVDGNDSWLWEEIRSLAPRVVVIEYNATFRPPIDVVQEYGPNSMWDSANYFRASLSASTRLSAKKVMSLVGCGLSGVNVFFVRNDCLLDHFAGSFTAEQHYMPPNYHCFTYNTEYHPPGVGRYLVTEEHSARDGGYMSYRYEWTAVIGSPGDATSPGCRIENRAFPCLPAPKQSFKGTTS